MFFNIKIASQSFSEANFSPVSEEFDAHGWRVIRRYLPKYLNILGHLSLDTWPFMSTYCAFSVVHDLPVAEGAASGIEVDAYLDYREAGEGELRGVVLQVYLLHGYLYTLVQLQLEEAFQSIPANVGWV